MVNYLPTYLARTQPSSVLAAGGTKRLCYTCIYNFSGCRNVEERPYCDCGDVLPLGKLLQEGSLFYGLICPGWVKC